MLPAHAPLIVVRRGDQAELIHYGSIAIVDADGELIAGIGDPQALSFTRSALKPLQALPFVDDGGLARWGFGSHELALMCASHNGEAVHQAIVARILQRIGVSTADLQCGVHPPMFYTATDTAIPGGQHWSPLQHNCSGKHSGFLAYCRLHGHRITDYLAPDSALQTRIRNAIQALAPGADLGVGTDGCSAPNYALPLTRLAGAYAQLACGTDAALRAVFFAMTRHPDLVSGTGRNDLALMQTGGGNWVSKIGADGVQAIGVRSRGIGIAIRIADGNARALHTVTADVLHQIGLLDDPAAGALAAHFRPALRNARGTQVGALAPLFALPRLA